MHSLVDLYNPTALEDVMYIILISISLFISFFIAMLVFSWRSDVSDQEPYKHYINTPLEIKKLCALTTKPVSNRFREYNLSYLHPEYMEDETTKKIYSIGDKIQFHAAKSFYSMHVGTSYHLIGKDTLKSGKIITFEYPLGEHLPRLWETMEEFLIRKKIPGY